MRLPKTGIRSEKHFYSIFVLFQRPNIPNTIKKNLSNRPNTEVTVLAHCGVIAPVFHQFLTLFCFIIDKALMSNRSKNEWNVQLVYSKSQLDQGETVTQRLKTHPAEGFWHGGFLLCYCNERLSILLTSQRSARLTSLTAVRSMNLASSHIQDNT